MSLDRILTPGSIALVTGAALGIGRAASLFLAQNGMSVCMVDLPGEDLDEAVAGVSAHGTTLKCPCDISDSTQIARLHEQVTSELGTPHLLMNNAVTRIGRGFDTDIAEWRRAMDVNFWGVVEATRSFLPDMLTSDSAAMIVNVGSKQGITNPPGHPIYNITKSALKTYTEALQHDLRTNHADANVSAHLLVPGWTTTGKNEHKSGAWLPEQVVEYMVNGLRRGDFYIICPDGEVTEDMDRRRIAWAATDITENRPPLSRWHPDFKDAASKACS